MPAIVIVGGQWGDEGKGKVVAHWCQRKRPSIVARAGVGPNAGHTVTIGDKAIGLQLTPSGFVYEGARLLIGPGVLVDPDVLLKEIETLGVGDRLGVDRHCGIIESKHREEDRRSKHLATGIGTTGTGCGPANRDRALRTLRLASDCDVLKPYLADVPLELNESLSQGKRVLVESAQGFGLSLFHGTYPYVTSKDTTAAQAAADVGVGPTQVKEVIVIFKAFPSRVGKGPFPTEMPQETAEGLGIMEYGTVTHRRRRIGHFDFAFAKRSCMLNGATQIALTKVDVLDPRCRDVKEYDQLTDKVVQFIHRVETETGTPVTLISTGPSIDSIIERGDAQTA